MSEPPPPPAAVCPMCGAPLAALGLECPQCGERAGAKDRPASVRVTDLNLSSEFAPATVFDWMLAGLTTPLALLFSLPTFLWMMDDVSNQRVSGATIVVNLIWNGWLWGFPLLTAWFKWHQGAYAGLASHSYVVRTYSRMQLIAIAVPGSLLLLLFLMCAIS